MKLAIDVPHREAGDIILQVRRMSLAFSDLQQAWDEFNKAGEWSARDRRIYDRFGNCLATADDLPMLYRFIQQIEHDAISLSEGHDVPYGARANE